MSKMAGSKIGFCPDCDSEIRLRKAPHLGQHIICSHCGTTLEVVNRMPLEFDWAFEDPLFDEEEELDDYSASASRSRSYDQDSYYNWR